jgi:hypothetical protein
MAGLFSRPTLLSKHMSCPVATILRTATQYRASVGSRVPSIAVGGKGQYGAIGWKVERGETVGGRGRNGRPGTEGCAGVAVLLPMNRAGGCAETNG